MIKIILFLFSLSISYAYAGKVKNISPTNEASSLVYEYTTADSYTIKKDTLDKLRNLHNNNSENSIITRIYVSMLASERRYNEAVEVLSLFNSTHQDPSLMLGECMLKDRVGNYDPSCYSKLIKLKITSGKKDIDYLTALFMTNDKRFDKEKSIYFKKVDGGGDMEIFKYSKREFLLALYPE